MIEIKQGDFVVYRGQYSPLANVIRADRVTAKQVRTYNGFGSRFFQTDRGLVVFAGSEAKAELVAKAINKAIDQRDELTRESRERYDADCAQFTERHRARVEAAGQDCESNIEHILEAARVGRPDDIAAVQGFAS